MPCASFALYLNLPASSALMIDDPLYGVPVALVPALDVENEHVLVPESAWSADGPGPLPVLADIAQCSVNGDVRGGAPGTALPRVFAPARHACTVRVLPAGGHSPCLPDEICAAINAPSGSPLPRLFIHALQRPGGVCSYVREGRHLGGVEFCAPVLYVFEVAVRGEPTRSALERLFHAYFTTFKPDATSSGSALLLRPLGGDAANAGLLAVLNLTAIQLAAGSLPAETLRFLSSGRLGILVRGAAASRAFASAELLRRAADSGAAPEGGVTEG